MSTKSLVERIMEQMETVNGNFNEDSGTFVRPPQRPESRRPVEKLRRELDIYETEILARRFWCAIADDRELSELIRTRSDVRDLVTQVANNSQLLRVINQNS